MYHICTRLPALVDANVVLKLTYSGRSLKKNIYGLPESLILNDPNSFLTTSIGMPGLQPASPSSPLCLDGTVRSVLSFPLSPFSILKPSPSIAVTHEYKSNPR